MKLTKLKKMRVKVKSYKKGSVRREEERGLLDIEFPLICETTKAHPSASNVPFNIVIEEAKYISGEDDKEYACVHFEYEILY